MKYFGTDGIRGIPFNFPFTPEFLVKIGYSIAKVLGNSKKPVYIATDTRDTGRKIIKYLAEGINSLGIKVYDLGVLTTPSLSYISSKNDISCSIMISASHNPPEFNGIKVFNRKGEKISDYDERRIEKLLDSNLRIKKVPLQIVKKDLSKQYINYIVNLFDGCIENQKMVIDCSNGSAYYIAPEIFKKLGISRLTLIGNKPNGKNINKGCGSLNLDKLIKTVIKKKASLGISYDGDADRCIMCDSKGRIIDGDDIICLLSVYYKKNKKLKNNKVVLTSMSNLGLVEFLKKNGISPITVDVGDKNVSKGMEKNKAILGGESSGHIIINDYLKTGDGIITSLAVLKALKDMNIKIDDIKDMWVRYPQIIKSFKIDEKIPFDNINGFKNYLKNTERKIKGRVVVRYSGTEPVIRILAEGKTERDNLIKIVNDIFDFYMEKTRGKYVKN